MTPRFELRKDILFEQINKIKGLGEVSYSYKTNPIVGQILEKESNCKFTITSIKHALQYASADLPFHCEPSQGFREIRIIPPLIRFRLPSRQEAPPMPLAMGPRLPYAPFLFRIPEGLQARC